MIVTAVVVALLVGFACGYLCARGEHRRREANRLYYRDLSDK